MKNLKLIAFAAFASLILAACQGSSNNNPATTTTACTQNSAYGSQYGSAYGQQGYPGCIAPNAYNSPYGYNNPYGAYGTTGYGTTGYGANTGNPCAIYAQQYGVMYYPSMVGGQMQCVASQ